MYVIAGKFTCQPNKTEALLAVVDSLLEPSRSEEGCISYHFYEDRNTPGDFLFFEEWRSREDIDLHFTKAYFLAAMELFPDLIIGSADIKIYQVESTEKV